MADSQHLSPPPQVALIGFGEAGSTFARAGGWAAHAKGWDILPARRGLMAECGVVAGADAADALAGAQIVLSLVTADSALNAAREYAPLMPAGAVWCDMNSVAPGTKRAAAEAVERAGGRYVDVAIMSPVDPAALSAPLLMAGNAAAEVREMFESLGFSSARVVGDTVGQASSIKMLRSVMIKGMEALCYECSSAASAAGVLEEVIASLDASEKPVGWAERFAYNRERMETHGVRRAAEMEESAATLQGLGVEPVMTRGTVRLQREAAMKHRNEGEGKA